MFNTTQLDTIVQSLLKCLPTGVQNLEQDMQSQFKSILNGAFSSLNLVTRDEFDVQTKVLSRTREKLDALEAMLQKMSSPDA